MKQIKKVIIPIAGYGSRMFPETLFINKAFLPIANKPCILHILEEVKEANISNVIFIISPSQKDIINQLKPVDENIINHFPNNEWIESYNNLINEINITFIIQEKANGLGDAIYIAKPYIDENEYFAVILGDNVLTKQNQYYGINELIQAFKMQSANYIGVIKVSDDETKLYGIVDGEQVNNSEVAIFPLNKIVEKPIKNPPSNFACLGRYIFSYDLFDYLLKAKKPNKELLLPDAIELSLKDKTIYGVKHSGKWLDVGNTAGFIKANIEYALQDTQLKEQIIPFLKKIK